MVRPIEFVAGLPALKNQQGVGTAESGIAECGADGVDFCPPLWRQGGPQQWQSSQAEDELATTHAAPYPGFSPNTV
jgi:hypothetical protein